MASGSVCVSKDEKNQLIEKMNPLKASELFLSDAIAAFL